MQKFLLYGANGYTAQLILPLCAQYGVTPILAGRNAQKIAPLAQQYGFEYRAFDLTNATATDAGLDGVGAVLHCAGPFAYTARPMMEACLRKGVHYLDITGEVSVFELAHSLGEQAKARGIVLLPGSGFDVVPTDCLALELKRALPDATHLALAFAPVKGGLSHGTALTMADTMGEGGRARRDGKIVKVPLGHRAEVVDFGVAKQFCMAIPWGDVATAYHTTGIPNIEVMTASSERAHRKLRWQWAFNWFLRLGFVRNLAKKKILERPSGPSSERREKAYTMLWGQASNASGQSVVRTKVVAEGYTLTAHTALWLTAQVLAGKAKPGFGTPAGLFGADIVKGLGLEKS
jgi:short subunit dehydrogenase-like uncharacterized protein